MVKHTDSHPEKNDREGTPFDSQPAVVYIQDSEQVSPGGGCCGDVLIDVTGEDACSNAQLLVLQPQKPPARFLRAGCQSECNATVNFFLSPRLRKVDAEVVAVSYLPSSGVKIRVLGHRPVG